MSDIFSNRRAWSPFFGDVVKVSARRGGAGVPARTAAGGYRACVLPMANDDPFAEEDAQSVRPRFSVLIAKTGPNAWNDCEPPRIGDVLELPGGMTAAVKKVLPVVDDWYELEARQC